MNRYSKLTKNNQRENPIKVLIVDDSALVRKLLTQMISAADDMQVIGSAPDPYVARENIKKLNPDVLTLDIEMPRMDGITFLKNLMRLRPMPVIMISTLTKKGADETLKALEIGATDFISKPESNIAHSFNEYQDELLQKLRAAVGREKKVITTTSLAGSIEEKLTADAILAKKPAASFVTKNKIVAIGASTGGTEAIRRVVTQLPAVFPGIVITQHIPRSFSETFAARLDSLSAIKVWQASEGQEVLPGNAYIAPGDKHLLLARDGEKYFCTLDEGPAVNRHKPSVDVLFRSVTQCAGVNATGVILTGMGADGAEGLKELQQGGAPTIAQDEDSSVVWGMPGSAVRLGAADVVLPLDQIGEKLIAMSVSGSSGSRQTA